MTKKQFFHFFTQWRVHFLLLSDFIIFIGVLLIFLPLITSTITNQESAFTNQHQAELSQSPLNEPETPPSSLSVVDIAGAIKNPGIYQLDKSARLADLIALAGGFREQEVDKSYLAHSLNLAEIIIDATKYYVPFTIEEMEWGTSQQLKSSAQNNSPSLISINNANLQTLMSLPGIGEVRAQLIIDHRPYSNQEELVSRTIITQKIYDEIKNLIQL